MIADDLLARFALTDAGDRKAATYSGGMRRRLDIAMEIKSAADTLARLPHQADLYNRVADRCTLAADPAHLDAAASLLPDW